MPATNIRQLKFNGQVPRHRSAESRILPSVLFGAVVVWIALCVPSVNAAEGRSDLRSLSRLFGESTAPDALEVDRLARQLPPEECYRYLLKQVLPDDSNTIRLTVDYLPTNPSPPIAETYGTGESPRIKVSDESRKPTGGVLISPAIELVKAAQQVGKLEELREEVLHRSSKDVEQLKAQLAIQILIGWTVEESDRAGELLNQLNGIVRSSQVFDIDRSPESVVIWSGLSSEVNRPQIYDLLYLLYEQIHTQGIHHRERFKRHISSLKFQIDQVLDAETPDGPGVSEQLSLNQWKPVSRQTAESRGEGFPGASWVSGRASVRKITCHDDDYLYFASPLYGDFEIEGYLTPYDLREIRLAVGGYWAGSRFTLNECENGFFRHLLPVQKLAEPMTNTNSLLRARVVVRNGVRTTYINGRNIYERSHGADADPWVAIYSPWNTSGTAENLRITGSPEIPTEVDMISSSDLPGWLPYFNESAGGADTDWRLIASDAENSHVLIGRSYPELRGANQESLLRYHRPMLEDGTIEYEFYYEDGSAAVFPAMDRCCFLFDRIRSGVHWLTDGRYDRTGLDPANFTAIATVRAETSPVPLIPNEWNHARLTLKGDRIEIALNGETIMTRTLEPENQRTFGLFHYADQTEARVRNLRWRGDWPKELPPLAEQELADLSLENGLANGPELPVVFDYDFSNGLLADKIWGGGREGWHFHKQELSNGLRISRGSGWYSHHTLSFPVRLEGDFDVMIVYEDFQSLVSAEGEGDLQLAVNFDDETATDIRVFRKHHHRKSGKHEQIIEMARFEQRENNTERNWHGQQAEEGTAGRIRVVRRKDQLFLLHAAGDSPHERLIHQQQVTTEPVRFAGLKAIVETHRDGETSVIWKRITVRSETPERIADFSGMTVEKLDRQRAKLPDVERIKFNQETSPDLIQSWGTIDDLQKQEDGWRVRKVGTDRWTAGAFIPMLGMAGDYDVTLDLEILKLEEAARDQDTYLLLQNRVNSRFSRNVEIKLVSTPHGKREISMQQNTTHRNGSTQFEKIKILPLEDVTRFRLARRGEVLYFIYQPETDAAERIFGYLIVGTDDIPPGFLRMMFRTGGEGKETIIKLKSMEIRADRIIKNER